MRGCKYLLCCSLSYSNNFPCLLIQSLKLLLPSATPPIAPSWSCLLFAWSLHCWRLAPFSLFLPPFILLPIFLLPKLCYINIYFFYLHCHHLSPSHQYFLPGLLHKFCLFVFNLSEGTRACWRETERHIRKVKKHLLWIMVKSIPSPFLFENPVCMQMGLACLSSHGVWDLNLIDVLQDSFSDDIQVLGVLDC